MSDDEMPLSDWQREVLERLKSSDADRVTLNVPHRQGRAALYAASDSPSNARDWHFGDEPCTYRGGCSEPLRSHYHLNPGPGQPIIKVVYYDECHQPDSAGGT